MPPHLIPKGKALDVIFDKYHQRTKHNCQKEKTFFEILSENDFDLEKVVLQHKYENSKYYIKDDSKDQTADDADVQ